MCLFFVTPEKNDLVRLDLAVEQGCLWTISQFPLPVKCPGYCVEAQATKQHCLLQLGLTGAALPHHPLLSSASYHNQKGLCSLRRDFLSCHLHLGLGIDFLFVKLLH